MQNENGQRPILGPWEFTEELAERLEQVYGTEKIVRRKLKLQLTWRGRPLVIELANFYAAYQRQPEQLQVIITTLLETVQSYGVERERTMLSFDDLKGRIYPMFKPIEILAEVQQRSLPMLAYRPFLADLIVTYVINEARSVIYINEEHLTSWGVKEPTLYQHALENLRQLTKKPDTLTVIGEDERRLMIYNVGDGYDAARLLLVDILEEWQQHMPLRLVIGIPNRDFLIAFSDANPNILQQVAQQISIDATHREYGLTDQLFTIIDGRIELYQYDMTSSDKL